MDTFTYESKVDGDFQPWVLEKFPKEDINLHSPKLSKLKDLFISYTWCSDGMGRDNKARVLKVSEALKARQLLAWHDVCKYINI